MGSGANRQTGAGERPAGAAPSVVLRLFASARQAAGTGRVELAAGSVGEALATAESRYGETFSRVLATSRVWVNGASATPSTTLIDGDEVAVLPPVSGGCGG